MLTLSLLLFTTSSYHTVEQNLGFALYTESHLVRLYLWCCLSCWPIVSYCCVVLCMYLRLLCLEREDVKKEALLIFIVPVNSMEWFSQCYVVLLELVVLAEMLPQSFDPFQTELELNYPPIKIFFLPYVFIFVDICIRNLCAKYWLWIASWNKVNIREDSAFEWRQCLSHHFM